MVVLLPGQYRVKDIVISRPPPTGFFFLSLSRRVVVILPGQYWVKDIVISRPPTGFFFFSAGGRHTPRSVLGEGYRNIPAPRRNISFFFLFFFLSYLIYKTRAMAHGGCTGIHRSSSMDQYSPGPLLSSFLLFCIYFVRIHRAPQSNGGRPWVVGWTLGTDPRGMSRAKCTAHRPWANIPRGHQFFTVPFV